MLWGKVNRSPMGADVADPRPLTEKAFNEGDVIYHWMRERKWTRARLAKESGVRRNTITDLINDNVDPKDGTIDKVLKALDHTEDELRDLCNQMNGRTANIYRHPGSRDRDDDKDEGVQYGRRISKLPEVAQIAIFNTVRAFELAMRHKIN